MSAGLLDDREVLLTGWGHSVLGQLDDSLESLIVAVGREAIDNAGLAPVDIEAIFLGQFNSGLEPLGFASALALQISPKMFGVPSTRVRECLRPWFGCVPSRRHQRSGRAGAARPCHWCGEDDARARQ